MRRPVGLTLLSAFFVFGALMAFLAFLGHLLSGGFLEPIWRLNPDAHRALAELGGWGMLLMAAVAIACALGAIGLWIQAQWGRRLAVGILAINLLGDLMNAVTRGDLRTLIGIPIGGAMIFYLLRARTRAQFELRSSAV
ncbi:MAG: hypothetical protein DMD38_10775 [Gemmatimonadetes bacterium]|nr:MAG: hypothetical protein DMD38_10775 [Gemmatimonadota bacterium]